MHMTCVSWLSYTSTNTTFLTKATDYFSHMLLQRRKYAGKKVCLNWGSNSQPPGHEFDTLTTEPPGQGHQRDANCLAQLQYIINVSSTLSQMTNFGLFQKESFQTAILNLIKKKKKNSKFPTWVENTVDTGEIARYEQFLLYPQCFQKACFRGASKGVFFWEQVKVSIK